MSTANRTVKGFNVDGDIYKYDFSALENVPEDFGNRNIVMIQDEQPTESGNRVWVKETTTEIEIPTSSELEELRENITDAINDVGNIKQAVINYNCFNILNEITFTRQTNNGITYEWQEDGNCYISGTASALSFYNIWSSTTSFPTWLVKGKKYWVKFSTINTSLKIWFYKNGTYSSGFSVVRDRVITVPTDVDGLIFRLQVENGLTVNETVHLELLNTPSNEEIVAKTVYCPELAESQKNEILNLISAYEAEKNNMIYSFTATHNSYVSKETAYDENGKLKLCCTTFAEMIWGGVSPRTFFNNPATYTGNIIKAFNWGYFNPYKVRQRAGGLANRTGSTITSLYGFTNPNGENETAFSYNTRYAANGELQNSQTWVGFLNAADLASELYINGYEVPASKADVGDLVFYEATPYSVNATYNISFRRIFHVAVITAKINGFFEVAEVTSADNGNGPLIRRSIFSEDDFCCAKSAFMQNRAVMFARHPSAYGFVDGIPSKFKTILTRFQQDS